MVTGLKIYVFVAGEQAFGTDCTKCFEIHDLSATQTQIRQFYLKPGKDVLYTSHVTGLTMQHGDRTSAQEEAFRAAVMDPTRSRNWLAR
jgi:hypothetical protein